MNFYYQNHEGDVIQFYDSQYVLTSHSFADWALSYETVADMSSGFHFGSTTKEFTVRIMPRETEAADRETAYKTLINNFVNVIAKDTQQTGKLWTTDGEYMVCRIVASVKSEWNLNRNVTLACTLLSDYPVWIKDHSYTGNASESGTDYEYLDFPYDFSYDYLPFTTGQLDINNTGIGSAHYKLIIYGGAVDPYITIDGMTIGVNVTVPNGGYLTIDSASKTVYMTTQGGTVTNEFNNRTKVNSIFDKISAGMHTVLWSGVFGFDLTLYEERREPQWI